MMTVIIPPQSRPFIAEAAANDEKFEHRIPVRRFTSANLNRFRNGGKIKIMGKMERSTVCLLAGLRVSCDIRKLTEQGRVYGQ